VDHRTGISSGTAQQQGPRWRQPEGLLSACDAVPGDDQGSTASNGLGLWITGREVLGCQSPATDCTDGGLAHLFFWAIPLGIVRSRQRAFLTGGCRWRDTALGRAFSSPARCSVGARPRIQIGPQQNTVQGYSAPLGATLPPPQAADFHPAKSRLYQQYQSD
jgi:hypothetical protein